MISLRGSKKEPSQFRPFGLKLFSTEPVSEISRTWEWGCSADAETPITGMMPKGLSSGTH